MKEKKLIGWIILGVALVVLGLFLTVKSTGSGDTKTVESFDPAAVAEIRIDVESAEVRVYDNWNASVDVDASPALARRLAVSLDGGVLTLTARDRRSLFSLGKDTLLLWLPADCGRSLSVSTGSGEVWVSGLTNENLALSLSADSGELGVYDLVASSLTAQTSSGELYISSAVVSGAVEGSTSSGYASLREVRSGVASLTSGSGGASLSDVRCRDAVVKTSSGYVALDDVRADTVTAESSSGSLDLRRVDAKEIRAKAVSGSIDASLEGSPADYTADVSSVSGDVKGVTTGGAGERLLFLTTTSGRIQVEFEG